MNKVAMIFGNDPNNLESNINAKLNTLEYFDCIVIGISHSAISGGYTALIWYNEPKFQETEIKKEEK